jgi:peptidylprolyl isomerase
LPTAMRRYFMLPLLVAALAFSACGDDNDATSGESGATTTEEAAAPAETPAEGTTTDDTEGTEESTGSEQEPTSSEPTEGDSGVKVSGKMGEKPKIEMPDGDPPKGLVYKDIKVGKGAEAQPGTSVNVQYVGALFSDGTEFDASWDRGEPFTFTLGQGMVIPGWDEGLVGMKEGGRRVLTIPPDMGYGSTGAGPIPPDSTLVFVVDLEKVTSP